MISVDTATSRQAIKHTACSSVTKQLSYTMLDLKKKMILPVPILRHNAKLFERCNSTCIQCTFDRYSRWFSLVYVRIALTEGLVNYRFTTSCIYLRFKSRFCFFAIVLFRPLKRKISYFPSAVVLENYFKMPSVLPWKNFCRRFGVGGG